MFGKHRNRFGAVSVKAYPSGVDACIDSILYAVLQRGSSTAAPYASTVRFHRTLPPQACTMRLHSTRPVSSLGRRSGFRPAAERDHGPDGLDEAKGPGSLHKAVDGAEGTCSGEGEDEPAAAPFQGIAHQHRGYREQAEYCQGCHRARRGRLRFYALVPPVTMSCEARHRGKC